MCIGSLLQSLDLVNSDAARLREQNFTLIRENVVSKDHLAGSNHCSNCFGLVLQKFASQNRELKTKYSDAKQCLATAQQQIKDLEQKLQILQLQPTSPAED